MNIIESARDEVEAAIENGRVVIAKYQENNR